MKLCFSILVEQKHHNKLLNEKKRSLQSFSFQFLKAIAVSYCSPPQYLIFFLHNLIAEIYLILEPHENIIMVAYSEIL